MIFQTIRHTSLTNWSVSHLLANQFNYHKDYTLVSIGSFLLRDKSQIVIDDKTFYKRVTIRLYNKGIKIRDTVLGKDIGTKKQFIIKKGQFLMSKIDARNGAFGIATDEVDHAIITADFLAFDIDESKIVPQFLLLLTTTKQFQKFAQSASSGTTGRQRMDERKFLDVKIPLPTITIQSEIIRRYTESVSYSKKLNDEITNTQKLIYNDLSNELGIEIKTKEEKDLFQLVHFKNLKVWSVSDILQNQSIHSTYPLIDLSDLATIIMGNSPSSDLLHSTKGGYKFIGGAADIDNGIVISERYIDSSAKISEKGDILYLIRATIGNPIFSDSNYYLGRGICAIRVKKKLVLPDYIMNVLILIEESIKKMGTGSTFKQISKPMLAKIKIPVPPLDVQTKLVSKIKTELSKISALKQKLSQNTALEIQSFENEIFNSKK